MQKLMIFMARPERLDPPAFRQALEDGLQSVQEHFVAIRYALVDEDVTPAQPLAIVAGRHPKDAVVSLYCYGAADIALLQSALQPLAAGSVCYRVDERVPLPYDMPPGRVDGMCQLALLKIPPHLTRQQWLDIWLNSHTQVAIATQSTFSYRQNVIADKLWGEALPAYDAVVEEQFPAEAMTDRTVFFNAPGDMGKYKANEKAMIDSVVRFVDFNAFECVPMSEYRFK